MIIDSVMPMYHPTRVLAVDDSENFLRSLDLQLRDNIVFSYTTSALEAVSKITEDGERATMDMRCISFVAQAGHGSMLKLDFDLIESQLREFSRFKEISVVVVDYDMPEMNGLDLCRKIGKSRALKILLTGVASEKVAIAAFNDGIIDAYLQKSSPTVMEDLEAAIDQLQQRYFRTISAVVRRTLDMRAPDFFHDERFLEKFRQICEAQKTVEYYFVDGPLGFLLVNEEGCFQRLIIQSREEGSEAAEHMRSLGIDSDVAKMVERGDAVYWPGAIQPAGKDLPKADPLTAIFPSVRIEGDAGWALAVTPCESTDSILQCEPGSFNEFMDSHDSSKV